MLVLLICWYILPALKYLQLLLPQQLLLIPLRFVEPSGEPRPHHHRGLWPQPPLPMRRIQTVSQIGLQTCRAEPDLGWAREDWGVEPGRTAALVVAGERHRKDLVPTDVTAVESAVPEAQLLAALRKVARRRLLMMRIFHDPICRYTILRAFQGFSTHTTQDFHDQLYVRIVSAGGWNSMTLASSRSSR